MGARRAGGRMVGKTKDGRTPAAEPMPRWLAWWTRHWTGFTLGVVTSCLVQIVFRLIGHLFFS